MMWTLFRRTVWGKRLNWLVYGLIAVALNILYLATFPAVRAQQATYDQLLNTMPKAILEAFNISQSSASLMGYMSAKHFGFVWPLMIVFLMAGYGGGALAGEVDRRTMGLLLSLPVSRIKLYAVRVAAGAAGLAGFVVISALAIWPLAAAFNYPAAWSDAVQVSVLGFAFGCSILGLSMMLSALMNDAGKVYGAVGGILLVMYVVNITAELETKLSALKYISLFHYFNPTGVVDGGRLDPAALAVFGAVSLVTLAVGGVVFKRRDISV